MRPTQQPDWALMFVSIFVVVAFIGMAVACMSQINQTEREDQTVPQAMPALLGATLSPPERAREILAPLWDDLQAVSPLTVTATEGGSVLRWASVSSNACEHIRTFFTRSTGPGLRLVLIQDGAVIDPGAYADLKCRVDGKTAHFSFQFKPRPAL